MNDRRIAVLVSNKGTGSILKSLIEAGFDIRLVAADTDDAKGVKIAKESNIPFEILPYSPVPESSKEDYRNEYSLKLAELLNARNANIAVLAGFNRILTKPYFENFGGVTINSHPGAILDTKNEPYRFEDGTIAPWNQGMMTDKAVANFLPLKFATSTIHIVTEEADLGPILKRVIVPVDVGDTVESLYPRLKKEEQQGLIEVLNNPSLRSQ